MRESVLNKSIEMIKEHEGLRLEAYPDPASPLAVEMRKVIHRRAKDWQKLSGEPWTIGYGSTGFDHFNLKDGSPTKIGSGLIWTQAQADARSRQDALSFLTQVESLLKVLVTDNQLTALVSFAYNCGISALKGSTLLKKLNLGLYSEAAVCFLSWNKAQGKVLPGLTKRREMEKELFLKP